MCLVWSELVIASWKNTSGVSVEPFQIDDGWLGIMEELSMWQRVKAKLVGKWRENSKLKQSRTPECNEYSIEELSDDALLAVLRKVPLRNRIALEQVNSRWSRLLKHSWQTTDSSVLLMQDFTPLRNCNLTVEIARSVWSRCPKWIPFVYPNWSLIMPFENSIRTSHPS